MWNRAGSNTRETDGPEMTANNKMAFFSHANSHAQAHGETITKELRIGNTTDLHHERSS